VITLNTKAEAFKKFVEEQQPGVFQIEELDEDNQDAAVFRSFVNIQGQQLPLMVVIDSSVFAIIRVQICPSVLDESKKEDLYKFANEQNLNFKPFKFFFNDRGDLMLESCLLFTGEEVKSEEIYLMFNVIIAHLTDNYRKIMKLIWGGSEGKSEDEVKDDKEGEQ